jgi:hypothetical protein
LAVLTVLAQLRDAEPVSLIHAWVSKRPALRGEKIAGEHAVFTLVSMVRLEILAQFAAIRIFPFAQFFRS